MRRAKLIYNKLKSKSLIKTVRMLSLILSGHILFVFNTKEVRRRLNVKNEDVSYYEN